MDLSAVAFVLARVSSFHIAQTPKNVPIGKNITARKAASERSNESAGPEAAGD